MTRPRQPVPPAAPATLNVRGIDPAAAERIRRAAGARQMTLARYLTALVALHEAMRARADRGDAKLRAELAALGLETVTQ